MIKGIIVKGISGFYYVKTENEEIVECKARGKFRREKQTPIVGDKVIIELIDNDKGVINEIAIRKSELVRPQVANVDQAVVVFAVKKPDISFTLLNKLLILSEHTSLDAVICLNKEDLDDENIFKKVKNIYGNIGYKLIKTNGKTGEGIDELKKLLHGKISVFSGPSGVGKSTLFNHLQNTVKMDTRDISEKISRGRHTTRHAELIEIDENSYIVDTPGFSSIDLDFIRPEELQFTFKEFEDFLGKCKFSSCLHFKENECKVKDAVMHGIISKERYNAYVEILQELLQNRRIKK